MNYYLYIIQIIRNIYIMIKNMSNDLLPIPYRIYEIY